MNSGRGAPITPGSVLQIRDIPLGVPIHNLEIHPGKGGQMVRAANTHAIIQAKQDKFAIIKLPSGGSHISRSGNAVESEGTYTEGRGTAHWMV